MLMPVWKISLWLVAFGFVGAVPVFGHMLPAVEFEWWFLHGPSLETLLGLAAIAFVPHCLFFASIFLVRGKETRQLVYLALAMSTACMVLIELPGVFEAAQDDVIGGGAFELGVELQWLCALVGVVLASGSFVRSRFLVQGRRRVSE
jgi:hypothetical protein